MNNSKWVLGGAIGLILIVLIGVFAFSSLNAPTVTAQGTYTLENKPDVVRVYIDVQGKAKNLSEAKSEHDGIYQRLISDLESKGFTEDEIKIAGYNTYPEYDWSDGTQKLIGYVVSTQIEIKTAEFTRASVVIDSAVGSGALVSYVNFELSDELQSELKAQALEKAGEDAKRKAEATARGLGKDIGRLVSVTSEDFYYPGPLVAYAREGDSASSAMDVKEVISQNPNNIEVTASLRVEYKLKSF